MNNFRPLSLVPVIYYWYLSYELKMAWRQRDAVSFRRLETSLGGTFVLLDPKFDPFSSFFWIGLLNPIKIYILMPQSKWFCDFNFTNISGISWVLPH